MHPMTTFPRGLSHDERWVANRYSSPVGQWIEFKKVPTGSASRMRRLGLSGFGTVSRAGFINSLICRRSDFQSHGLVSSGTYLFQSRFNLF